MSETLQQYFHRVYPDHCARICEEMRAPSQMGTGPTRLARPPKHDEVELMIAFPWADAPEGWEYWARLSRAEGNPMDEAFIQECVAFDRCMPKIIG